MSRINYVHLAGGGVTAGVIYNVSSAIAWETALSNDFASQLGRQLSQKAAPTAMIAGYAVGMIAVSLYLLLSERQIPWIKAATMAAAITWLLAVALPSYMVWSFGMFSGSLLARSSAFGAVEILLATLMGAWVYNWGETMSVARARRPQIAKELRVQEQ